MKTVTTLCMFLLLVCVAECKRSYEDPRCAPPAQPQIKKLQSCARLISKYAWNTATKDCALLRYYDCFDTGKHFSQISDCRKRCTPESSEEDDLITYVYNNVFGG